MTSNSEIIQILAAKKEEKLALESQINRLEFRKIVLDDTLAALDHLHKEAIEKAHLTEGQLKWYRELKSNLKKKD